jgi:hypothetical protein
MCKNSLRQSAAIELARLSCANGAVPQVALRRAEALAKDAGVTVLDFLRARLALNLGLPSLADQGDEDEQE